MDIIQKSKLIIAGFIWCITIITWWYAIRKIPRKFLIQDVSVGLGLMIALLIALELIFRKYKLGSIIESFNEWPSMWIGLYIFILGAGSIKRYLRSLRIKEKK